MNESVFNVLENYSFWIIQFSKKYRIKDSPKIAIYLSGLIEEIAEYENEKSISNVPTLESRTEIGDILAYWMLCINFLGISVSSVRQSLFDPSISAAFPSQSFWFLMKELTGQLKRLLRDEEYDLESLKPSLILCFRYIEFEVLNLNSSFVEIIQINQDKLNSRILAG